MESTQLKRLFQGSWSAEHACYLGTLISFQKRTQHNETSMKNLTVSPVFVRLLNALGGEYQNSGSALPVPEPIGHRFFERYVGDDKPYTCALGHKGNRT
jgi:hypothetical protein